MNNYRHLFFADSLYVSEVNGNTVNQKWKIGISSNKPMSTWNTDYSQSGDADIQHQFFYSDSTQTLQH